MSAFKIIGHRGACAHEPENTLLSVRRAIADGADMIEIDVRPCEDQIIVIHDDTLERTTNGSGSVYEKSFQQLRELDAGKGEQIPTLEEVLELTRDKLPLNIEIKDAKVTTKVCELVRNFPDQVLISSFDSDAIRQARKLLPTVPIGVLAHHENGAAEKMLELATELQATTVNPHVDSVTPELVKRCHKSGYQVLAYTARTEEQLSNLLASGADGCFADDPAWARELARKST